ncbi:FitA-like ribbon-helix-helix domain-containing protein [Patulibacter defluvii]|uniref:FitA-like ribbon-helix-helix domain-containing protein n=1 Tax=Patulibacter defluvii TaxID=3095358 RepID=UPI002A762A18|nr:ribbon-helix-helix protein, CopG family [Patulibacter sp. DM4]
MIQVRNVPEDLHEQLRARAADEGVSLSELIRRELPRIAREGSMEAFLRGLDDRGPIAGARGIDVVGHVRADRERR